MIATEQELNSNRSTRNRRGMISPQRLVLRPGRKVSHGGAWAYARLHNTLPAVIEGTWSRDELIEILKTTSTRDGTLPRRVLPGTSVNEAVDDDAPSRLHLAADHRAGICRHGLYLGPRSGPGCAAVLQRRRRGRLGVKSDAIYALVKGYRSAAYRSTASAWRCTSNADASPDPAAVAQNIERYRELGLQVHVTEMDVFVSVR